MQILPYITLTVGIIFLVYASFRTLKFFIRLHRARHNDRVERVILRILTLPEKTTREIAQDLIHDEEYCMLQGSSKPVSLDLFYLENFLLEKLRITGYVTCQDSSDLKKIPGRNIDIDDKIWKRTAKRKPVRRWSWQ